MTEALASRNGHEIAASAGDALIERIDAARAALGRATTVQEVKGISDGLAALCELARRQRLLTLDQSNRATLVLLLTQARLGWWLKESGVMCGEGRPPKKLPGHPVVLTLGELGLKWDAAAVYQHLARLSEADIEALAEAATRAERRLTQAEALRLARRRVLEETETAEEEARSPCPVEIPARFHNRVVTGDARELARELPDESIALCFCDPVYHRIEDYEWIAGECERVLMPGGNLIVQCGNTRRFECEVAMRRSGLQFVDLLAEVYPYALNGLFHLRVQVGWKPYLWFSKGKRKGGWVMNRSFTSGKRQADRSKAIHPWGDGEEFAYKLLQSETAAMVPAGGVVWDPFAGSGLLPVVCARLGLPFVAFEIEPELVEKASLRLAGIRREGRGEESQSGFAFDEENGKKEGCDVEASDD